MARTAASGTHVWGDKVLHERIVKLLKLAPQLTRDAVNEHALNIQAQGKRNITDAPAVDTGQLRSSVKIDAFHEGLAQRVGSDVKQSRFIEFGTGPHFPPIEPIKEWVRRHGLPESAAYPIALAISKRGTPAKPWLWPAFEQERPKFQAIMRKAWRKMQAELNQPQSDAPGA